MREVARMAGVSVATVGNVLNNPNLVAPATRLKVEEVMLRMEFVRSGPARQLRGLPSNVVGVITLDLGNPFYAQIGRGIEDQLAEAGCITIGCSTDVQVDRERKTLAILEEQAVRGIIISPVDSDLSRITSISRRGMPVVLLDQPSGSTGLCAVAVDNVLGGRLVAEHLLGLGHRNLAFLNTAIAVTPVAERLHGLSQGLRDSGVDPKSALLEIGLRPPRIVAEARAAVDRIVGEARRPTAIVCLNDLSVLGVLQGLQRHRLRVPDDVSVVGYDDLPFAAWLSPPLTTVRQPTYRLGRTAAELLLDEARADHQHREVRFAPELIVRGSTGPPP
jgi:LacI family transcriptional regulator